MPLKTLDRVIEGVKVVDDDADVRNSYRYAIAEADLVPHPEEGPLPPLATFTKEVVGSPFAVLCDHHLRVSSYADFEGAELAAECYAANVPALLCTNWEEAQIDIIRRHRPYIPVLLKPEELTPDSLIEGFETVVSEFVRGPGPTRRPWRTQVAVVEVDGQSSPAMVYVEVPAWTSDEVIRLPLDVVDPRQNASVQPGDRLHAKVNLGATRQEDLYFMEWERG